MSACLSLEQPMSIAFLGPEGTFTQAAAIKHFGHADVSHPQATIDGVFEEVESGNANYGVVPVENSTEGVVTHTLDMFVDSELKIVSQIVLPIQHCLVGKGKRSQIRKLYTHPQTLAQCRGWIQNNLPHAEIIETSSNARSAELAAREPKAAAITGALAAERYGLAILEARVQDNAANATRFLVLGRQCSPPSGHDRTSLMISLMDKVGALHSALAPFRRYRINMTKIESRPSKKKAWEYFFFVDFLGHCEDAKVKKALGELAKHTMFIKILGSYPNVNG